jgi:hypothetical protein
MSVVIKAKRPLTKRKSAAGETLEGYPLVRKFEPVERGWQSLADLHRDMQYLQRRPNAAVVRGALTDLGREQDLVERRAHQDPKHFEDVDRAWLALDLDGVPAPPTLATDREARARYLVDEYLPEQFRGVSVVVQWTSSEGWKWSHIYARLWYWSSVAAPCLFFRDLIKSWMERCPALDSSLFNPVQPHYTSPPIIEGGDDPVERRILYLEQTADEVDLSAELRTWRAEREAQTSMTQPEALEPMRPIKYSPTVATSEDEQIARMTLGKIKPVAYAEWVKVGMALHSKWPDPAGLGFQLWDSWSAQGAKYKPGQTAKKWSTFGRGRGVTFASLVEMGRQARRDEIKPGGRPAVDLVGDLEERSKAVLDRLTLENKTTPRTWTQGPCQLVRLLDDKGRKVIDPLRTPEALRQHVTATTRWRRYRKVKGEETVEPCDLPLDVCRNVLASPKRIGALRRVSRTPGFDPSGRLWDSSGYCEELETWFDLDHLTLGRFDDVQESLDYLLREVLVDFPFADEASRVHALALLILPMVRGMIQGPTPLHLVTAPLPRTGKTKLVNVCSLGTTGGPAELCPPTRDNEEWRKQITATLRGAPTMALIDNLEPGRNTDSANLAALLTSTQWTARELGTVRNVSVPNDTIWTATGNNPGLSRELADRSLWIHLDPAHHDPSSRTNFQIPYIEDYAKEHQGHICGAIARLVLHWLDERGQWSGTLGGFERWSEVVGGILTSAGLSGDLLGNRKKMRSKISPGQGEWEAFVLAWHLTSPLVALTSSELWNLAEAEDLLDSIRGAGNERSQKTKIGIGLRGITDRVFRVIDSAGNDLTLQVQDGGSSRTRAKTYKLVEVGQ